MLKKITAFIGVSEASCDLVNLEKRDKNELSAEQKLCYRSVNKLDDDDVYGFITEL